MRGARATSQRGRCQKISGSQRPGLTLGKDSRNAGRSRPPGGGPLGAPRQHRRYSGAPRVARRIRRGTADRRRPSQPRLPGSRRCRRRDRRLPVAAGTRFVAKTTTRSEPALAWAAELQRQAVAVGLRLPAYIAAPDGRLAPGGMTLEPFVEGRAASAWRPAAPARQHHGCITPRGTGRSGRVLPAPPSCCSAARR